MKSLLHGFRNYFNTSGCDSRSIYWSFIASTHLVLILLFTPIIIAFIHAFQALLSDPQIIQQIVAAAENNEAAAEELAESIKTFMEGYFTAPEHMPRFAIGCGFIGLLWGVGIIIPTLNATMRRLRDAGHSPWWAAAPVAAGLPIVGGIGLLLSFVTLILCFLPSVQTTAADSAELPPLPEQN